MDWMSEFGGIVVLPGGLVLDDEHRIDMVELRPLTGYEERWLARHPAVPCAVAVSHVLGACLSPKDDLHPQEMARRLLVGDRDHLMVQLRRLTLGDSVFAVLNCPGCLAKMDVTIDLSLVPVEGEVHTSNEDTHSLPGRDRPVRFRLPTGEDQEAVLRVDAESRAGELFARCLLDDGGEPLTDGDREAVVEAMERSGPRIEIDIDLTCPECGEVFEAPFDPTTFFFCRDAGQRTAASPGNPSPRIPLSLERSRDPWSRSRSSAGLPLAAE